jgi:hypothetical protein
MRRLIVCCDGTWNAPEDETVTNVRRLANALGDLTEDGNAQVTYYQPGVGTEGYLLNRLLGGSSGVGLSRNVVDGYHWLTTNYRPGDRIALFGFSRGAYTARSIAGMISACGLIETGEMDEATVWRRILGIYQHRYRSRDDVRHWRDGLDFRFDAERPEGIPIDFIGVWDTVGALGIPDYLGWLKMLDPLHRHDFHDVTLNPYIAHGRHAVAMDDMRSPYTPTLWAEPFGARQEVKQVWFPGSHKDVGGGHLRMGLSDGALQWMIDEARDAVGLGFNATTVQQVHADPLDVLHDDDRIGGLLQPLIQPAVRPWLEIFLHPQPRAVPKVDSKTLNPSIHSSVYRRHLDPPITGGRYRPTRVLGSGENATADIFAQRPWNETGLYLDPGEYVFSADGEWRSAHISSGPAGTTGLNRFNPVTERIRLLGTLSGQSAAIFRAATGNKSAEFLGSARAPNLPWMSLVGVVANNVSPANGTSGAHECISIGSTTRYEVTQGGYLYAFANDAWGQHQSNQGSVRLTVTRLPAEQETPTRRTQNSGAVPARSTRGRAAA